MSKWYAAIAEKQRSCQPEERQDVGARLASAEEVRSRSGDWTRLAWHLR